MTTRAPKAPVFFANPAQLRALGERLRNTYIPSGSQVIELGPSLPGISTREDAYSLAILLVEALGEQARLRIAFPATGFYGKSDLKGLSPQRRRRFFVPDGTGFRAAPVLASKCGASPPPAVDSFLELSHESVLVLDLQRRVLSANQNYCELFQVDPAALIGKSLFGSGPGQWKARAQRTALRSLLSYGQPFSMLDAEVAATGPGILSLNIRATDCSRSPVRLVSIRNDTVTRKLAEESTRLRLTVDALLESATQTIIGVQHDGQIVLANGNTREMFGYAKEELLGRPLSLLIPEGARLRHKRHHKEYFKDMGLRTMGLRPDKIEALRKDGSTFPVEIGLSAVPTPAGQLAIAFIQDVSERRALEQAIRARSAEVQSLAANLLTAKEEIERRVSRELHDQICQPLAALALDLGALASSPDWELLKPLQARVIQVSEEARHMAYELHPTVLDDLGLVTSMRALCKEFSRKLGFPVAFTSARMPAEIPREVASCLYRVTQEALQNVVKHSAAGEVSVSLTRHKRSLAVQISDDGDGFTPTTGKTRGGLGLIGMEERARLAAGKITVASSPGRGTVVKLNVPLEKQGRPL